MAEGQPGGLGKILGLIAEHDEHPEAFEASLILAGIRWRDVEHPSPRHRMHAWQDIAAVILTLPWDAPLSRTRPDWEWADPHRDLLVGIYEAAHNANVQRGNQSEAKEKDFVHVPRPGEAPKNASRIGSSAVPLAEMDAFLAGDFEPVTEQQQHGGQHEVPINN